MDIAALVRDLPRDFLLGLTGAPGVGKSTFAAALADAGGATVVPMDGFHLADEELRRRGLLDRKGAPETFDAWGYAALLERVRDRPDHVVMAPAFERTLEQPLAGALPVPPDRPVVTEGNYLLLPDEPWRRARRCLDQVWHLTCEPGLRRHRLVERHVRFGRSPRQAAAWVERVDEPNARLVERAASGADRVLDLTGWTAG